jgi:hypothetical protein
MLLSPYDDHPESFLALLSGTTPLGTRPVALSEAARLLGYEVEFHAQATWSLLQTRLSAMVGVNPGLLAGRRKTPQEHAVVVKEFREGGVLVNDPGQVHGAENRLIPRETFRRAWESAGGWLLWIGGKVDEPSTSGTDRSGTPAE